MKKILFASSLLALASGVPSMASAAGLAAGANAISTTDCALLSAAVNITLSTGNVGAYICNTSTANIGVAVASTSGKNKVFSIGSSGGALTTTTTAAAPGSGDASTAATTVAAVSS